MSELASARTISSIRSVRCQPLALFSPATTMTSLSTEDTLVVGWIYMHCISEASRAQVVELVRFLDSQLKKRRRSLARFGRKMTFDARKTTNLTSHLNFDPFVIHYLSWDDLNHTRDSFSLSERDRTSIWPSEIERCSCDHCCTQLRPNKIAPLVASSPVASQCLPADSSIWPMQWCKCVCVSLPVLFDRQTQT